MEISWLDDEERIGVGGAVWHSSDKMAQLKGEGITHIINMQAECDDAKDAAPFGIEVLENPTDDDFLPKGPELFRKGVDFARKAFAERADAKLYIHCAAGVHRAPMMALAVLCSMDVGSLKKMDIHDAMQLIEEKRPVADFADVYVRSVERFLAGRERS
jgi:protein-tyrosine phosphatase